MKLPGKNLPLLSIVFLFILNIILIVNVFINTATGAFDINLFYNADALFLPALYKDLFSKYPLSGWYLPPAPCFFPDMLLYFTLNFITGNFHIAIMLFGFIQCALFLILSYYLTAVLHGKSMLPRMLSLLVAACYFYQLPRMGILNPTVVSTYHFAVILAGITALILVSKILSAQSSYRNKTVLLFALSGATVASDLLFLVQFILPMTVSVLLLYLLRNTELKKTIALLVSLVLSVPAGIAANTAINHYSKVPVTWPHGESLSVFKLIISCWFENLVSTHYVLVGIWLALFAYFCAMAVRAFFKKIETVSALQRPEKHLFVIFFTLFCVLFNMVSCILSCNGFCRYFLATIIMPFIIGPPLVLGTALSRKTSMRLVPVLLITFMAFAVALPSIRNLKNLPVLAQLSDHYPVIVKCLDQQCSKYGITNGLSLYWEAKYFSMLSKKNLHIVQVWGGQNRLPAPRYGINNLYWYDEKFEFIIFDPGRKTPRRAFIDKSMILECFGPPAHILQCQHFEVLVYNRASDMGLIHRTEEAQESAGIF